MLLIVQFLKRAKTWLFDSAPCRSMEQFLCDVDAETGSPGELEESNSGMEQV